MRELRVIQPERKEMTPCLSCGKCCTYLGVQIDTPKSKVAATEVLWYLYHQNVSVIRESKDEWLVCFDTARCKNLQDDNKCAVYEQRPLICSDLNPKTCEVNKLNPDEVVFRGDQGVVDFLEYLREHHKGTFSKIFDKHVPEKFKSLMSKRPRNA